MADDTLPTLPLPAEGDFSSQIQQGNQLFNMTKNALTGGGTPSASDLNQLLGAGVTPALPASVAAGFSLAKTLVTAGMAVTSGAAVGGPFGAVAGAFVGVVNFVEATFNDPYQGVIDAPGDAAKNLYNLHGQWEAITGHTGYVSQKPQGWSFADVLASKYPPAGTRRMNDLWAALNTAMDEYWQAAQSLGLSNLSMAIGMEGTSGLAHPYNSLSDLEQGMIRHFTNETGKGTGESGMLSMARALATPVFFQWAEPSKITDVTRNEYSVPRGLPELESTWNQDTGKIVSHGKTLSIADIQKSALARRPDPLYFDADLYVAQIPSPNATVFFNLEALSMLASVLSLLAVGASTRAILSELLLQQHMIANLSSDGKTVPYLCRMLVEDYVRLAHQEWKETKAGQIKQRPKMHTIDLVTTGKVQPTSPMQAAALTQALATMAPQESGGLALAAGGVLAAGAAGGLWWWLR